MAGARNARKDTLRAFLSHGFGFRAVLRRVFERLSALAGHRRGILAAAALVLFTRTTSAWGVPRSQLGSFCKSRFVGFVAGDLGLFFVRNLRIEHSL
jgi:hypothetical protein